jgi:SAM-dependent methyltransferase
MLFWSNRWKTVCRGKGNYDTDISWTPDQYRRELETLEKALAAIVPDAGDNQTALDYGCGLARFAAFLQGKGWHYVGADLLPEVLTAAKQLRPSAHFVLADDAVHVHADLLFLSLVIQHFHDDEAVSLLRKLPGREIIVLDDTNADSAYVKKRSVADLETILRKAGFPHADCLEFAAPKGFYRVLRAARGTP